MNEQERYDEDLLSRYINPEGIEKAPEGFTSKVMAQIKTGDETVKATRRMHKINLIPVISCTITILLVLSVFIIPENKGDFMALPAMEFLKNIKSFLREIDFTSFFRFSIPVTLVYGLIGILILSLLDRALYGVFHKEK
jgi:hypothetical protein